MSQAKQLKLTLIRSPFGRLKVHKDCVRGLGLRRVYHTVQVTATPENLGMVRKIGFMLKVEDI
jgi:large subunit ribosomal protein L30